MSAHDVTIQDIADRAKVSISTVSRVLRGSAPVTEQKRVAVLKAVRELDYQPNFFAQGLASGESKTIGVVTQDIDSQVYNRIMWAVLETLRENKYSTLFADGSWQAEREERAIQVFIGRRVDGLIIIGGATPHARVRELAERLPLIVVGRAVPGLEANCLHIDNRQAARDATRYLIDAGHRQIAHITGLLSHSDAVQRLEGYKQALVDHGIEVDEELIIEGDFSESSGMMAAEMLMGRGRTFSAIFSGNDQTALGARLALERRGLRVPEDVSLVGFDDQPLAAFMTPPLTTVRQPAVRMGRGAARAVLALIRGEPIEPLPLPATLVQRESVAQTR